VKNRKKITFIIRGTSARLVSEDIAMQKKVKAALDAVFISPHAKPVQISPAQLKR